MSKDSENNEENFQQETSTENASESSEKPDTQLVPFDFSVPKLSTQFSGNFNITNPVEKNVVFSATSALIKKPLTSLNFTNEFQISQNKLSYKSRALNFQHKFDNKSSDADLNIQLADNSGNYSLSVETTYNNEGIGTTASANANLTTEEGNINYSVSATVHNECNVAGANVATDASANVENGNFNYSVQTVGQKEIKGVENSVTLYSDNSQSYASFSSSKKKNNNEDETQAHHLLNLENPNGNEEQQRVEQLKNSNYVFNFMTKEGYSAEKSSFFSENSLIAMLGRESYTNLTHRVDKNSNYFNCKLDLKKFNIDYNYNNTKSEDGIQNIKQNLSTMFKGKKTIIAIDTSKEKTIPKEGEQISIYTLGANTSYGRDEYSNVFGSGLNFQTAGGIVLNQAGKVDGYEASADVAWNRYGSEHGGKNDVLLQARYDISDKNNVKNTNISLCSLFRFNNEWTCIEPQVHYSYTKTNGIKDKTINCHLGFYQEIGKKWGDAYFGIVGEYGHNFSDRTKNFAGVKATIKKQATKRLTFGAEAQCYTNTGVSGNINMQVNL